MVNLAQILFGFLTLLAATGVIAFKRPLNSALSLVATLFLVAVHFAMLDAHLLATLQVLIYAGAIMVLVIFVIMLLGVEKEEISSGKEKLIAFGSLVMGAGFVLLCGLSLKGLADFSIEPSLGGGNLVAETVKSLESENAVATASAEGTLGLAQSDGFGTTRAVGELMFTDYLLPFQLIGLLLLAAIIGSVLLAQDVRRPLPPGRGLKDKQGTF